MALLGQASGGWLESSSALRLLHVGTRNTVGVLTDDAFTQTNPPVIALSVSDNTSVGFHSQTLGVLSGSVAFTRPDQGSNLVGGPTKTLGSAGQRKLIRPLGCFINSAAGNAFENQPAVASGKGPYVSQMGTYASQLFETNACAASGAYSAGDALTYTTGMFLMASQNGYLTPGQDSSGATLLAGNMSLEVVNSAIGNATVMGVLKMPADSTQPEIVFDQRI